MKYQEVGGGSGATAWNDKNLTEGAILEGRYVDKKTGIGPNKSNMYILEDNKQKLWGVWGSTVVDGRFTSIAMGKMVKIQYKGQEKGKNGKTYKSYQFWQGIDSPEDEGQVYDNTRSGPSELEELDTIDLDG